MVSIRSKKDYQMDADRLAENLFVNYGRAIKDRESFEASYRDYMGSTSAKQDSVLKDAAFNRLVVKSGGRIKDTRPETRQQRKRRRMKEYERVIDKAVQFKIAGTIKGRIVLAKAQTINIKGVTRTILRDRKGRFAKRR